MVPVSLISQMTQDLGGPTEKKQEREQSQHAAAPPDGDAIAAYERIIAEKDARIKDLTEALEHERERSRRHAEAHTRLQALLALTHPP